MSLTLSLNTSFIEMWERVKIWCDNYSNASILIISNLVSLSLFFSLVRPEPYESFEWGHNLVDIHLIVLGDHNFEAKTERKKNNKMWISWANFFLSPTWIFESELILEKRSKKQKKKFQSSIKTEIRSNFSFQSCSLCYRIIKSVC